MGPTPIGVDAVSAIVDRYVMPQIIDGVYNSNPLIHRFYKANKINRQGGTQIEVPVLYKRGSSGGWYRGYDKLALAPQDSIKNFAFGWAQAYETVTIDGLTLIITDSDQAIANHITMQVEVAKMEMMERLAEGMFGQGPDGDGDDKSMVGLGAIIDDGTDVTQYGGRARSGLPYACASLDAATSTLTTLAMRKRVGAVTKGAYTTTLIAARQEQYDRYWALLQAGVTMNREIAGSNSGGRDEMLGAAGFHNLMFDGIPFVVDSHVPDGPNSTNSEIQFICEPVIDLFVSPRADLFMEEFQKPADMDAMTSKLLWAGNMACGAPRLQSKLTNISA